MAENFKNYSFILTMTDEDKVIVPDALSDNNEAYIKNNEVDDEYGKNTRKKNSTVQLHSMYMTNVWETRVTGESRYNEDNFKHVDLYIKDENYPSYKLYIAHDVELVPGCPYYIEKNITLTPSQSLYIHAPSIITTGNQDVNINLFASAIEFSNDVE